MNLIKLNKLIERCNNGESIQSLCREFSMHRHTIYAYCKKNGIQLKSKYVYKPFVFDEEMRYKIALEYINGNTSSKMGKKYNVSHKTILKCVKEFHFRVRTIEDNRELNGEPLINNVVGSYRGCAAAKKHGFSLSYEIIREMIMKNCYYCGNEPIQRRNGHRQKNSITLKYTGLDRIDSNMGYHVGNVVPCCFRCNSAKNNMSLSEFKNWIDRIIKHGVLTS